MEPRPIEDWQKILGDLPAPEGENMETIMGNRILGDMVGYRHGSRDRLRDAEEVGRAMVAYARMMFDAGVRP
jgi:hypothetical protein